MSVVIDGEEVAFEDLPKMARRCFRLAKRRADATNRLCLSEEQFIRLWHRGGGRCELTHIAFSDERLVTNAFLKRPWMPSLDRINNGNGYEVGNVRLVVQAANFALNAFPDDVFLRLCRETLRTRYRRKIVHLEHDRARKSRQKSASTRSGR